MNYREACKFLADNDFFQEEKFWHHKARPGIRYFLDSSRMELQHKMGGFWRPMKQLELKKIAGQSDICNLLEM